MAVVLVTGSEANALFITSSGSCVLLPQDTFEYEDTILNFYEDNAIANVVQSAIAAGRIPDAASMSAIIDTFYANYLQSSSGDPEAPSFVDSLPQDLLDAINLVADENSTPFSQSFRSEAGTDGVVETAVVSSGPVGNVTMTLSATGAPEGDEYCRVTVNDQVVLEMSGLPATPVSYSFFRLYSDEIEIEYRCGGSAGPVEAYALLIAK